MKTVTAKDNPQPVVTLDRTKIIDGDLTEEIWTFDQLVEKSEYKYISKILNTAVVSLNSVRLRNPHNRHVSNAFRPVVNKEHPPSTELLQRGRQCLFEQLKRIDSK